MKKLLLLTTLFSAFFSFANAQVKFGIQWLENEQAYQVSLVSEATWVSPSNIVGTAQVTVKAPAGALDIYNVKNLQNDVEWEMNARYDSPVESPGADYFSFGLSSLGTKGIQFLAGEEIPLFSFQNANDCAGTIELVDNEKDAFLPPNSAKANIANQMTVLGAGGKAFKGVIGDGKATCNGLVSSTTSGQSADKAGVPPQATFGLYPTNVTNEVNMAIDWQAVQQKATLRLFQVNGALIRSEKIMLEEGDNFITLPADQLRAGSYFLEMEAGGEVYQIGRFIKN